jgi:hypothetical protein
LAIAIASPPVVHQHRLISVNVASVLGICVVFAALIALGFYATIDRDTAYRQGTIQGAGGLPGAVKAVPLVGAAGLGTSDPVVRFSETRIGHVLFSKASSDECQRVLFDNRTGSYYDAPDLFCGQSVDQVMEADTPNRLLALKKSFQR